MRNFIIILSTIIFVCVFSFENLSQTVSDIELKPSKSALVIKKAKVNLQSIKREYQSKDKGKTKFRSPFRYIIFSILTEKELGLEIPQLWLEVLMDEKAFNQKNLKLLFSLLAKRFPIPVRLNIKVHTNLATIETPEESEMISDHSGQQFEENYHKTATYDRSVDGKEAFTYAYGRPPGFWEKTIILPRPKQMK